MARKIVQIAAHGEGERTFSTLFALCDDGSVWSKVLHDAWFEIPAIPQDDEPETVMAPVDRQTWPPNVGGMDLWVRQDEEPVKIIDRDTFWIAVASKDQIVAAFFSSNAAKLLDKPGDAPETWNFDYEGQSFTVPANPIPF